MQIVLVRHRSWVLPALIAMIACIAGSAYGAFASSTTFYACLSNTGTLSKVNITAPKLCGGGAVAVQWNQVGPTGPQGATGAQGPQGPIGPQGPVAPGGFVTNMSRAAFTNVDLRYRILTGVNLSYATLTSAKLDYADLTGADLSYATVDYASLPYVNLMSVNLTGTNLTNTILSVANLSNANLSNANFTNGNLSLVNFYGATGGTTVKVTGVIWYHTTCPDNTNSDNDGNTCVGHGF